MKNSKIWFDASTVKKLRNHSPVGLTRVEANVLQAALDLPQSIVRFCTFNRYGKKIEEFSRSSVQNLLDNYGSAGDSGHGVRVKPSKFPKAMGRFVERQIRVASRSASTHLKQTFGLERQFPEWNAGDVFVISGATWDSVDDKVLEKLVVDQGLKLVAIVADMIPVIFPHQFQSQETLDSFSRFAELVARYSELPVCISKSTQNDFENFATARGISAGKSQVIYLGSETPTPIKNVPPGLPTSLDDNAFVISVSTIQVRKNHQLLYQLWRRFAEEGRNEVPRLVLVGSPGWLTNDLRCQIANDPLVQDSILVLNHVNDAQLNWLYNRCEFSLYPSLYEGWGLPIVESLSRGKPCIASNTSSMPEASQGLALHLDPHDFRQWHNAILHWSSNKNELMLESERVKSNFRFRSWADFGQEFCSQVENLVRPSVQTRAA